VGRENLRGKLCHWLLTIALTANRCQTSDLRLLQTTHRELLNHCNSTLNYVILSKTHQNLQFCCGQNHNFTERMSGSMPENRPTATHSVNCHWLLSLSDAFVYMSQGAGLLKCSGAVVAGLK